MLNSVRFNFRLTNLSMICIDFVYKSGVHPRAFTSSSVITQTSVYFKSPGVPIDLNKNLIDIALLKCLLLSLIDVNDETFLHRDVLNTLLYWIPDIPGYQISLDTG